MSYPTDSEITQAAEVLQRLPRGFLPLEIFRAFAERTVLPCLELSIFRKNDKATEVLLTQRPADDYYWPSAWHLPGGVLLATDEIGNYNSMISRILDDELKGTQTLLHEPQFVLHRFQETERGRELVLEYFSQVASGGNVLPEGKFFPVDMLPEGTLGQYYEIIPATLEAFSQYRPKVKVHGS